MNNPTPKPSEPLVISRDEIAAEFATTLTPCTECQSEPAIVVNTLRDTFSWDATLLHMPECNAMDDIRVARTSPPHLRLLPGDSEASQ
ncbi:hypothetical protein DI005_25235 [Prauserella sp. PE36]|uniref:hypothetical protein n=1 Tax=Prauserella sp. PE36 TaxID=1504709 RepID=UPI000DE40539|nr:hypothetical protein [Prauserella sp. PE36]RBM16592.1 hypothetical protein DI005_25235 [Prauserella sp. PE36]